LVEAFLTGLLKVVGKSFGSGERRNSGNVGALANSVDTLEDLLH
jgi:hypothetical protein